MLILENLDCEYIRVTTDPETYPQLINDNPSDICCWTLTLGVNCCEPKLSIPIRGLYDFAYSIVNCGFELVNDVNTPFVDIQITGIDAECVSQVTMTNQAGSGVLTFVGNDLNSMTFRSYVTGPSTTRNYEIVITTTCDLDYSLQFIVIFNGDICTYTTSALFVEAPELPAGVTMPTASEILLSPEAFGFDTETFPAGVYFVGVDPTPGAPLTNSIFMDCEVICKVIDYVSKYPTSNTYMIYDALRMSNDCLTSTYNQKCTIWNYLGKRLGYFISTPCPTTSSCPTCSKNK
jgi:hypothetical protein